MAIETFLPVHLLFIAPDDLLIHLVSSYIIVCSTCRSHFEMIACYLLLHSAVLHSRLAGELWAPVRRSGQLLGLQGSVQGRQREGGVTKWGSHLGQARPGPALQLTQRVRGGGDSANSEITGTLALDEIINLRKNDISFWILFRYLNRCFIAAIHCCTPLFSITSIGVINECWDGWHILRLVTGSPDALFTHW